MAILRTPAVIGGANNVRGFRGSSDLIAKVRQTLFAGVTDLVPAGITLESLETIEIPAGTLSANKARLIIEFAWSLSAVGNRRRSQITFGGTVLADFDTSDAASLSGDGRVVIYRETSSVIKCISSVAIDGISNSNNSYYNRVTGLDLANNNYDVVFKLRNYSTATDSYIRNYSIDLAPAP